MYHRLDTCNSPKITDIVDDDLKALRKIELYS